MVAPACRRPPSKTASFLAATVPASKPAFSPASAAAASRKKSPFAKIFPKAASAFAAAINTPKVPASKSPSLSLPAPAPSSSPSASSSPNPSPPPASTATAPPTSSLPSTRNSLFVPCRGTIHRARPFPLSPLPARHYSSVSLSSRPQRRDLLFPSSASSSSLTFEPSTFQRSLPPGTLILQHLLVLNFP